MSSEPDQPRQRANGPRPGNRPGFSVIELLVVISIIAILVAFLLPNVRRAREPARRSQCKNNLKLIGLALHNYAEQYGALPPAYTVDAEGRPLHSWRTLILPYVDQQALYESIDLSKPWDDPANAEAYQVIPSIYRCPSPVDVPENSTTYLAVVGPSCGFHPTESRTFSEFADGPSETVMVIDASSQNAVHWMDPRDDRNGRFMLQFGPKTKLSHEDGINALFADFHVEFIDARMPTAERRAMITISGNDNPADEEDD